MCVVFFILRYIFFYNSNFYLLEYTIRAGGYSCRDKRYTYSMVYNARFGRELRKLTRQAKICTPPGGEVIAKICVLRSKDLYILSQTLFATDKSSYVPCIISSRRLAAAATFHIGNFVAAAIKIIGFLLLFLLLFLVALLLTSPSRLEPRLRWGPVCENLHSPPRD